MLITEASFVAELVAAVPETRDLVSEHLRDNFGELLLHPLMADLLRFAVKNFHSGSRASSQRLLAFVDRALRTGDAAVENAVAVSFVEHIGANPGETPEFLASWSLGLQREKDRQNHLVAGTEAQPGSQASYEDAAGHNVRSGRRPRS